MRKKLGYSLVAATAALALAACGSSDDGGSDDNGGDNGDNNAAEDADPISVGVPAGWDEGVAISYLWANMLEEEGYEVELEDAEIGPIFADLASGGGYDLLFDAWLPTTHASYVDEYGDDIDDLGVWYDDASLNIAVNSDAPIDSLDELADNADVFDNRIVGIDPGAGLTEATEDEAIPDYGLDDMEFVISSTSSMLAELKGAMDEGDDIVVTLWHPHWAYDEFDVKDLEDPEGSLGDAEEIHTYANLDFADDYPEVADWIGDFTFDDDQLAELENIMFNENDGDDNEGSVEEWLEDNPDFKDELIG